MIVHVVLFSPKPDLPPDARRAMLDALVSASSDIPSIRKFRVGKRVTHSLPGYEQLMRDDYEFSAVIEFEDLEGLKSYLRHPSHADIGRHFSMSAQRALAYDYEVVEAADASRLV